VGYMDGGVNEEVANTFFVGPEKVSILTKFNV